MTITGLCNCAGLLIDIYIGTNKEETRKLSMRYLRELDTYIRTKSPSIAEWWNDEFTKVLKSKSVYDKYNIAC